MSNRYLLDTNILAFSLSGETHNLSQETRLILEDYSNLLYTSSVSVLELLQLYRIKKIQVNKFKTAEALIGAIEDLLYIQILPFAKQHTETLSKLEIAQKHNDPFDHAIIAHAMTEKLILVSSDRKFHNYTGAGLDFVFNRH